MFRHPEYPVILSETKDLAPGFFAPLRMTNKHFISIDYGTRKCGLAYSVESFCFAHTTITTKDLVDYLSKWEKQKSCHTILIGLPLNIDGTESKHSGIVRKFAKELENLFPNKKILLHDERLTTSEARLSEAEDIDAESARLILEDYIRES